jgi:3-deoxy-manno-octulosonate cytidylyltransferase (CMP-KDO synthetase)
VSRGRDASAGAVAVIPARYASTRFPGKPLAALTGKPLIQHVVERARQCQGIARVIVATDDLRIHDAARDFGCETIMTRADHPNGTSRIAEVAQHLDCELVVNIQGDEPELEPELVDLAIGALQADGEAVISTVASPFAEGEDPSNPNVVKCAVSLRGRAMLFSRSAIPFHRDGAIAAESGEDAAAPAACPLKHVGLYVYRRTFLPTFVSLEPAPLELTESLEQLRVLEHGYAIAVALGVSHAQGIDTPEQYAAFVARWRAVHG